MTAVLVLAVALVASGGGGSSTTPWSWAKMAKSWSWDRINTLTWGTNSSCCPYNGTNSQCCSIYENPGQLRIKSRYDVIFQDNDLNEVGCRVPTRLPNGTFVPSPGSGGMDTLATCIKARSDSAGRIKAAVPADRAVLDYRGIVIAWWDYQTPEHKDWWVKGDTPGSTAMFGVIDWRNKAAADYYVNDVVGLKTATDPNIDGIFVDSGFAIASSVANLTYANRVHMQLAQLDAFKRICTMMAAHGKVVTVSLKSHFGGLSDQQGMVLCPPGMSPHNTTRCMPFGEDKIFEVLGPTGAFIPHRQFNIPSRDFGDAAHGGSDAYGCVVAVLNLQKEAAFGPVLITNNDGAMATGTGKNGQPVDYFKAHNTSLAAFLLGMGEQSYFGSGLHWADNGWDTDWPAFKLKLGMPDGPLTQVDTHFTRSFKHLTVSLNCASMDTSFDWKGQ